MDMTTDDIAKSDLDLPAPMWQRMVTGSTAEGAIVIRFHSAGVVSVEVLHSHLVNPNVLMNNMHVVTAQVRNGLLQEQVNEYVAT